MHTFPTMFRVAVSVSVSAALVACGGERAHEHGDGEHGDGHVHTAPNGGTLVELGDHFANAEFLLDAETGTLTMYTLGGHAEKSVRSPSESVVVTVDTHGDSVLEVTLAAQESALSKEAVGDSSVFVGQHDDLMGVDHFHGKIVALTLMDTEFKDVKFDFPGEGQHHEEGEEHSEGEDHGDGDHGGEHEG